MIQASRVQVPSHLKHAGLYCSNIPRKLTAGARWFLSLICVINDMTCIYVFITHMFQQGIVFSELNSSMLIKIDKLSLRSLYNKYG